MGPRAVVGMLIMQCGLVEGGGVCGGQGLNGPGGGSPWWGMVVSQMLVMQSGCGLTDPSCDCVQLGDVLHAG